MTRSWRRRALWAGATITLVLGALSLVRLAFAPTLSGTARIARLRSRVEVSFDRLAIPTVRASERDDALTALGYVTARDRLFQMDLMRRSSAGRLAAIFGAELVERDRSQRIYGFEPVAERIVRRLPQAQLRALEAYARGVNAYVRDALILPFEFQLLGYRPEPWTARDSLLVVLGMYQSLSDSEALERTRTIVKRRAPREVAAFLYAGSDPYTDALLEAAGDVVERELPPVPPLRSAVGPTALAPRAGEAPVGSNGWAIAKSRTRDGRALVANDMHLDLSVPNVWYRAELVIGERKSVGLTLPGVPLMIAGSNGKVAWGLTNVEADVLDLVELVAVDRDRYESASGAKPYVQREEQIEVRGAPPVDMVVRETEWGPVSPRKLLGRDVALRWTALDDGALDLGLIDLLDAEDLESAITVFQRAGMPPLNVLLADAQGEIAWTVTGRYPRRRGYGGEESASFHDGSRAWDGYLEAQTLPRIVRPASGYLINANQRMAGSVALGSHYAHGYRAYRIRERLAALQTSSELDSLALQLDTRSEPYELYRRLGLAVLTGADATPARRDARVALAAWDGRAERTSRGFALVRALRRELFDRLFAGWLHEASAAEPGFELDFADVDTPLARALESADDGVFAAVGGRDRLLLASLDAAIGKLTRAHPQRKLEELRWGELSKVELEHPLSALPALSRFLDMPRDELAGCGMCVRLASGTMGASERMVVAPGREADGILHMPGGQSGSPFSEQYDDQQAAWVSGKPLPLRAGAEVARLTLLPEDERSKE